MILHKYYDNYGLDTLKNLELKANYPSAFNDPFEFLPKNSGQWDIKQSKRKLRDIKSNEGIYRVLKISGIVSNEKEFKFMMEADNDVLADLLSKRFNSNSFFQIFRRMKKKLI